MKANTTLAWAIKISRAWSRETALAGVLFFTDKIESHHDGMRTALFSSRRSAESARKERFPVGSYSRASYQPKVVRVKVSVEAVKQLK